MTIVDQAAVFLDIAQQVKTEATERGAPFMPTAFVERDTEIQIQGLTFEMTQLDRWARKVAPVTAVVLVADTYVRVHDELPAVLPRRGDIAKAFHEGDFTVREALVLTALDHTGKSASLSVFYSLDDHGKVVYEEQEEQSPEGGWVLDCLHIAVNLPKEGNL